MRLFLLLFGGLSLALSQAQADGPATRPAPDQTQVATTQPTPTTKPSSEGFIRDWLVLGPVPMDPKIGFHDEESCKDALDEGFFTEQTELPRLDNKLTVNGVAYPWQWLSSNSDSVDLGKWAESAGKTTRDTMFSGRVYILAPREIANIRLGIGSDDDSAWRLNGKEVIRWYEARGVYRDQNLSPPIGLKEGWNVLRFVVLNGESTCGECARFIDLEGNPVPDLIISVVPPQ